MRSMLCLYNTSTSTNRNVVHLVVVETNNMTEYTRMIGELGSIRGSSLCYNLFSSVMRASDVRES